MVGRSQPRRRCASSLKQRSQSQMLVKTDTGRPSVGRICDRTVPRRWISRKQNFDFRVTNSGDAALQMITHHASPAVHQHTLITLVYVLSIASVNGSSTASP